MAGVGEKGVDVMAHSGSGSRALRAAAVRGFLKAFQWLVCTQPSREALSKDICLAGARGHLEVVKWIVEEAGWDTSITMMKNDPCWVWRHRADTVRLLGT